MTYTNLTPISGGFAPKSIRVRPVFAGLVLGTTALVSANAYAQETVPS